MRSFFMFAILGKNHNLNILNPSFDLWRMRSRLKVQGERGRGMRFSFTQIKAHILYSKRALIIKNNLTLNFSHKDVKKTWTSSQNEKLIPEN